jgi:hypothetical protein
MKRTLPVSLLIMLAGSLIIALPDTGPRLYSFSTEHGPSLTDAAGIAVLLSGFSLIPIRLVRRRAAVGAKLMANPVWLAVLAFVFGTGLGLIVASVFSDFWWWWLIGGLLQVGCWIALVGLADGRRA